MSEATYRVGDVFERMAELSDGSVDLIVTSPPFLALRSYLPADHPDKHLEIGSEATPAAFLSTLLALTREWRRVLAPHGSIAVELGDTYSGSGGAGGDYGANGLRAGQPAFKGSAARLANYSDDRGNPDGMRDTTFSGGNTRTGGGVGWPLAKSLCLLSTLYPACLAYGRNLLDPADTLDPWRIRNLIVWHRPNPPVGALGDKVRPSTSYVTTACVSPRRWFDLDAERGAPSPNTHARTAKGVETVERNGKSADRDGNWATLPELHETAGAPPLDMWNIPTAPYTGSHYATFPPALPRKLINLMCPRQVCTECGEPRRRIVEATHDVEDQRARRAAGMVNGKQVHDRADAGASTSFLTTHNATLGWTDCGHGSFRRGIVLDPFAGSGTTLIAASELGRDSIGIDLDERNLELARQRCGLFLSEAS